MDALGILIFILVQIIGVIAALLSLIFFIIGLIKKKKVFFIIGGSLIALFIIFVLCILAKEKINQKKFEEIPLVSIDDGKLTLLYEGSDSMGSTSYYLISKSDVLALEGSVSNKNHLMTKNGYAFTPVNPGDVYIAFAEFDCGKFAYANIFYVCVNNDLTIETHKDSHYNDFDIDVFRDKLHSQFGFTIKEIDEFLHIDKENDDFEYRDNDEGEAENADEIEPIILPPYKYTGDDIQEAAIVEYFVDNYSLSSIEGSVSIPGIIRFSSEMIEDNTIKVYGNFWMYEYALEDTVMKCVAASENPGVVYLKETDEGYAVDEFDRIGDGSNYVKDVDRICKDNEFLRSMYTESKSRNNKTVYNKQWKLVRDYLTDNDILVTKYD